MIDLLIATTNPAKLARYQRLLGGYDNLSPLSPEDLDLTVSIQEAGSTPQANARLKAEGCQRASGLACLGIDEALYIPALPADEQPSVYVRRQSGERLSDQALLEAYLDKARRLSFEQRIVKWVFALCLALPDGSVFEEETGYAGRFSLQPRLPYTQGYPLSALLVDDLSGKPVLDLTEEETRQREKPIAKALERLFRAAGLIAKLYEEPEFRS
jgi:inosine/xanthosine triphosphate pyrophosphatase family protein